MSDLMTVLAVGSELTPLVVVGGGVAAIVGLSGGIGWRFTSRKMSRRTEKFKEDYSAWKTWLSEVVVGNYSGTHSKALQNFADLLNYRAWGRLRECEQPKDRRATRLVVAWKESPYGRYERVPEWDYPVRFINSYRELANVIPQVTDEAFQEEVDVLIKESAAHWLLVFRPTPQTKVRLDPSEVDALVSQQKALYARLKRLIERGKELEADWDGVIQMGSSIQKAEAIAADVLASAKATESASNTARQSPLLTVTERQLVEAFQSSQAQLSSQAKQAGEVAIGKLNELARNTLKATKFSPAGREQALHLANESRRLAVAELSSILAGVVPAEEQETIYALRVENKYWKTRVSETTETVTSS